MHGCRSGLTAVAVAIALAAAPGAAAQESINHGSVSGRVTDGQGGVLPGATVTARQVETDVTASTSSPTAAAASASPTCGSAPTS